MEFNIFEPRYRLMFGRAACQRSPQGVPITLAVAASPSDGMATLAVIDHHEELDDGRLRVVLRGERRFLYQTPVVRPASFGLWCATPQRYLDDDETDEGDEAAETDETDEAADATDTSGRPRADTEAAAARLELAPGPLAPRLVEQLRGAAARHGWSLAALDGSVGRMPPLESTEELSWWFAHVLPAPPDAKRRWFTSTSTAQRLRDLDRWMRDAL